MNGAAEYLASIKARIVAHSHVVHWAVVREEAQGDQGLWFSGIFRSTKLR